MNAQKSPSPKKNPPKRSALSLQLLAVVVIAVAAVFFFIWHQMNFRDVAPQAFPERRELGEKISVPDQPETPSSFGASENREVIPPAEKPAAPPSALPDGGTAFEMTEDQLSVPEPVQSPENQLNNASGPAAATEKQHLSSPDADARATPFSSLCRESARSIRHFYQHLDEQSYIQNRNLTTSSEEHFTSLIQKLLDNPPVVSGETNDLFTILQNTAHFFRIIGKDNILLIKAILDQEKDRYEYVLADFYSLLHIPGCPQKSFNLRLPPAATYEYAGFFLGTMGGRLYLFRRDSMSRMIVSFYAILLVDKANKNASNKYGIEIAAAIDQLIEEMESTTYNLQLKNHYLDKLYDLKEEYQ